MKRAPGSAAKLQKAGPRPVSRPHDRDEREAEHAADVVSRGGSVAGWSFSSLPVSAGPVQRQEGGAPKPEEEKYKEAALKAGEAALATPQGQALKEKVLADPLVKSVKDAVTSPGGIAATTAAAAGGVAALAATGKELPVQPPAIPLDKITPGLSAKVTYQGPVNAPTFVGLTLTYKEQGPKSRGAKQTATEKQREENARLAAEQAAFRSGLRFTPGSKAAEEQRLTDEAIAYVVAQQSKLPGLTIPLVAPEPKKEETETPVQPAPAGPGRSSPTHAHVHNALATPGRPLDPPTRRSMEARFGYDFSGVRVHDDARAAAEAARIDAAAFTVGEDVVFGAGRHDPGSPAGRRLIAHELAHVVQQSAAPGARVQREQAAAGATVVPAQRADYEEFVDMAVEYLDGARDHYRSVAQAARSAAAPPRGAPEGQAPGQAPAQPEAAPRREEAPRPAGGAQQPAAPAAPPAPPGLDPDRLRTVLEGLLRTYEGSRQIVETQLGGDTTRLDRLRTAYLGAADAARAAATSTGRVNLVFIAAPRDDADVFITNATTYARLYFSTPAAGDTVHMQEAIASPDALFDAIETTQADRMIRRIDIFCHGTIEPTHQIRFGPTWYRVEQIEAAAASRARAGRTLQNQTRFDGSTVIELHACRLGAPTGQPGTSGLPTSSGEGFLRGFGGSVGGARGQEAVGYEQRWVPRRFEVNGVRSTRDVASGPRARAFDRIALQYYNAIAGSMELQTRLTEAERAGAPVSDARKIEIMRQLFDDGGGAWVIGHQYATEEPRSVDLARDVGRERDTFTNEADWTHLVLRVRVPAAGTGATP